MKKYLALFFVCIAADISAHSIPSLSSLTTKAHQTFANIKELFHPNANGEKQELVFELPSRSNVSSLSTFQKQFRSVIQPIDDEDAILSLAMEITMHEANRSIFSIYDLSKTFLSELETAGTDYIKKIMKQTLDVDIDSLTPAVDNIKKHLLALQHALKPIEQLALKAQLEKLSNYFFETKDLVDKLMNSNFLRISDSLNVLTMDDSTDSLPDATRSLVTTFKKLFNIYPTLINEINKLKIKEAGLLAQHSFNESSELLEQVVLLHTAAGKLGQVLIQDSLIKPIDIVKNRIRRLGNSIEFTTSSSPIIVVAPPTTYAAMVELFKTFAWGPGIYLKPMVEKEAELAVTISKDMISKLKPITAHALQLENITNELPGTIQRDFIQAIKESPLVQIPRAPQLLLEVVEYHIAKLKRRLNKTVTLISLLTQELSMLISSSSTLLGYINQYMGATTERPFINNDIVRGIGFIAEDVDTLSYSLKDINAGLAAASILGIG